MAVLDRRAALEEAFDMADADEKGEEYVPPEREVTEESDSDTQSNIVPLELEKDPAEVEAEAAAAKEKTKEKVRTKGVPLDERKTAVKADETTTESVKPATGLDKAPIAWGANRDALWAKVPADVRGLITKREAEIQQGMSQAGRIRQVAEEYHSLVMPYENIIKHIGTTPKDAINNVMQTATMLIVGTQAQKCAIISEMIERYQLDLPELDKEITRRLEGKGKNPQPNTDPTQLDPRILQQLQPLFSLQQRLEQAEGQKQETLKAEAAEAINSVASEQFFEDVRDDMADIMEISAKRGVVMTIKQAYDKACQLNPEVSKLVAKIPKANTPNIARARRAASTVRGAPASTVTNAKMDRRAALSEAWDAQGT